MIIIASLLVLFTTQISGQEFVENWERHINKGKELYTQERFMSASEEFTKASNLLPTDTLAYVLLINTARFTKQAALAFEAIKKMQNLNFNSVQPYNDCLNLLIENQFSPNNVFPLIRKALTKFPNNKQLKLLEICAYLKYGQYADFLKNINQFIILYPEYNVYLLKTKALLKNIQDTSSALTSIKNAEIQFPDSLSFFKMEYTIYLKKHELDKAQVLIEQLLDKYKNDPELYYNLALLYFEKEEYEQSAEICKKAIKLDPDYVDAIYNVGTFYYYQGLLYNSALSDMTVNQYVNQGREFEKQSLGFLKQAKPYLKRAVELNPSDLDAYENLNTVTELIKNLKENESNEIEWEQNTQAIQITDAKIIYPDTLDQIQNGESASLSFKLINLSSNNIDSLKIHLNQPIITAGLEFKKQVLINFLASKDTLEYKIPLNYNLKSAKVKGIEKAEGAKDKIRFFAQASGSVRSELSEVSLNIFYPESGEETVVADNNINENNINETVDIDFNPDVITNNFLIVIGIDKYKKWPELKNPVHDARAFENELINEFGFTPDFTYELFNDEATHEALRNTLIKVKRDITENDNLIIYYAGHGYYDKEFDDGYWIPVDARQKKELDYIPSSLLIKYLSGIPSKHTVIVADACFSGSLFVQDDSYKYKKGKDEIPSRWGFSSGNLEYVADGGAGKGSPFANFLIEYLHKNPNKKIPMSEIIKYVSGRVQATTGQNPIGRPLAIKGNQGGEFIFTKKTVQ